MTCTSRSVIAEDTERTQHAVVTGAALNCSWLPAPHQPATHTPAPKDASRRASAPHQSAHPGAPRPQLPLMYPKPHPKITPASPQAALVAHRSPPTAVIEHCTHPPVAESHPQAPHEAVSRAHRPLPGATSHAPHPHKPKCHPPWTQAWSPQSDHWFQSAAPHAASAPPIAPVHTPACDAAHAPSDPR